MADVWSKSSGYRMGCFADETGLFWHRLVGVDKHDYRRKFRSQTRQDGQMKSRDGKSRRDGKSHGKEEEERESHRRKKIQVRERVGKSRSTVFLHWFVAPEGQKVGSLKRRVRSPLGRWEMKNCTTLWREAHFGVNMLKKHTFGPLKLRCRKSARRCGAKHISKSKC